MLVRTGKSTRQEHGMTRTEVPSPSRLALEGMTEVQSWLMRGLLGVSTTSTAATSATHASTCPALHMQQTVGK